MNLWIRCTAMAAFAGLGLCRAAADDSELPFIAKVAIEELESYRADITEKAAKAIGSKREQTIVKLEAEAAKQSKASNTPAATAILKVVADLRAEEAAEKKAAELASRRWTPLFEPDNLPATWQMPKEPDGGWSYKGGVLEMLSLLEYAPVFHEAPEGDLVVRAKIKLEPNKEAEKEKQAGMGFFNGGDMMAMVAQDPGLILAAGKGVGVGAQQWRVEANAACQEKYADVQIAWVGTHFLVFARGKLVHDCDVKRERLKGNVALIANRAKGYYREVEMRQPDRDDIKRLLAGRPLQ